MRNRDPIVRSRAVVDRDAGAEPIHAPYFALWIEDATYIDPIMDAWARDVVRRLIEGFQTRFCALIAALAKLVRYGRSVANERPPAAKLGDPSYGGPTTAALFEFGAIFQTKPKRPL